MMPTTTTTTTPELQLQLAVLGAAARQRATASMTRTLCKAGASVLAYLTPKTATARTRMTRGRNLGYSLGAQVLGTQHSALLSTQHSALSRRADAKSNDNYSITFYRHQ